MHWEEKGAAGIYWQPEKADARASSKTRAPVFQSRNKVFGIRDQRGGIRDQKGGFWDQTPGLSEITSHLESGSAVFFLGSGCTIFVGSGTKICHIYHICHTFGFKNGISDEKKIPHYDSDI